MKKPKPATPNLTTLLLRIGLALTLGYAAVAALINPDEWAGYLPPLWDSYSSALLFLKGLAICQLLLAVLLLSGVYLRYAAMLSAGIIAIIFVSNLSILSVTFRDIGLIFASVALALSPEAKAGQ